MYILYKIFNNLLSSIWNINSNNQSLMYRDFSYSASYGFNFDLSHSSTHLGDKLFFFPLFKKLIENNINFKVTDNGSTNEIFHRIYGFNIPTNSCNFYVNIIPRPSFLALFYKYKNIILIDFTDFKIRDVITLSIINTFNNFFDLKINDFNFKTSNINQTKMVKNYLNSNDKYIIFNNYVKSGIFRLYFIKKDKLINKCISLKKSGYKVIHVGSLEDKVKDKQIYSFVDHDLRGRINLIDLISLIDSDNVVEVVTFDNFIMHIAHLFNKSTWVLFRGRFTKSMFDHHIKYVNNTFKLKGDVVNYL